MDAPQIAFLPHPGQTLCLGAGTELALQGLQHAVVRVRRGEVWLTQHRDVRDYILGAGQQLLIDTSRAVVVQALRDAEIDVLPRPQRPRGRFLARLPDLLRRVLGATAFLPATPH